MNHLKIRLYCNFDSLGVCGMAALHDYLVVSSEQIWISQAEKRKSYKTNEIW